MRKTAAGARRGGPFGERGFEHTKPKLSAALATGRARQAHSLVCRKRVEAELTRIGDERVSRAYERGRSDHDRIHSQKRDREDEDHGLLGRLLRGGDGVAPFGDLVCF